MRENRGTVESDSFYYSIAIWESYYFISLKWKPRWETQVSRDFLAECGLSEVLKLGFCKASNKGEKAPGALALSPTFSFP
jgi:hypothetical protein